MENRVSNAVDFMLKHCHNARWDIIGRAMKIMEEGIMKEYEEKTISKNVNLSDIPNYTQTLNVKFTEETQSKAIWSTMSHTCDDKTIESIYKRLGIEKGPAKCNCDTMLLMRQGCKCGGI